MTEKTLSRRSVVKGAAWTVPVIAATVAAPFAAASTSDVGAFRLQGTCGVPGFLGPGFVLSSSADTALPVGTSVRINGSGVADIGVFSVTGGTASVTVLSGTSRLITLTSALPAGSTMELRTTLSISVTFTMTAETELPAGYAADAGAKPNGTINSNTALCSAT